MEKEGQKAQRRDDRAGADSRRSKSKQEKKNESRGTSFTWEKGFTSDMGEKEEWMRIEVDWIYKFLD